MTKQQIAQAIESYISGQGNQAGLQGLRRYCVQSLRKTKIFSTFKLRIQKLTTVWLSMSKSQLMNL